MITPPKETLFETAFAPLFNCYVKITKAHQDSAGEWIFTGNFDHEGDHCIGHLFRACELKNFVL